MFRKLKWIVIVLFVCVISIFLISNHSWWHLVIMLSIRNVLVNGWMLSWSALLVDRCFRMFVIFSCTIELFVKKSGILFFIIPVFEKEWPFCLWIILLLLCMFSFLVSNVVQRVVSPLCLFQLLYQHHHEKEIKTVLESDNKSCIVLSISQSPLLLLHTQSRIIILSMLKYSCKDWNPATD